MEMFMKPLQDLGVNSTLWFQLALFLVGYVLLSELVFRPYLKAHHQREKLTVGDHASAEQIISQTEDLRYKYETRAREMNARVRDIFEESRATAKAEQERLVRAARQDTEHMIKQTREQVTRQVSQAREELSKKVPEISRSIVDKMLGHGAAK